IMFYVGLYLAFIVIPIVVILEKSLCYTYREFHIVCPTCGITRAFSHIMHGEFLVAFQYHPIFTCCIFPISTFLFTQDTFIIIKRMRKKTTQKSLIEFLLAGCEQ
ncbi:MAG: DUF2752 domain-containing protein, partial [Bacilli bacterium]|nr:DUF2752 domain-containing protein [Bacilli bacterium]